MVILVCTVVVRASMFPECSRLFHLLSPFLRLYAARRFVIKRNWGLPSSDVIKIQHNTEGSIRKSMDRNDVAVIKPKPNRGIELSSRSCDLIDDRFGFNSSHACNCISKQHSGRQCQKANASLSKIPSPGASATKPGQRSSGLCWTPKRADCHRLSLARAEWFHLGHPRLRCG